MKKSSDKISILLSALNERYKSIHTIRERVQSVCVWALGLLLAAGSWLIQSNNILTPFQKVTYILGTLIAFAVLRFVYLGNLQVGFKAQQRIAVRIEQELGLFTPKALGENDDSIYPGDWARAGSANGDGKFFTSTYALLYVGVVFLLVAILFNCGGQHFYLINS